MNGTAIGNPAAASPARGRIALYVAAALTTACTFYGVILTSRLVSGEGAGSIAAAPWPFAWVYVAAIAAATFSGPAALRRAVRDGRPSTAFSCAGIGAALAGYVLHVAAGDAAAGATTMRFYWGGLAVLWVASVAMIHASAAVAKPLAVRDWTIYAVALAVIPLTLVPSLPLWPMFFELDAAGSLVTAATASFATHLLIAHYVIFEILESRPRR